MEFKDYYKILNIDKSVDAAAIKKAYRKLARKYHPDVSKEPDALVRMKEINEANAILSDVEKRAAYDALGSGNHAGQNFRPPPDWDAGFEFTGNGTGGRAGNSAGTDHDFSDFFASMFSQMSQGRAGGQARSARAVRGEDHHAKVVINLADTYEGSTKTITLRAPRLGDSGQVVNDERTLAVKIPKGIKAGQQIRLAGQGSAGYDGSDGGKDGGKDSGSSSLNGDLYLEIQFSEDASYRVDGRDVIRLLPVTPWEAALGGEIEATTPSGTVQVKIPPGSKTGQKLRLKARGIPAGAQGDPPGDLYLELLLLLPPANTERAREIYETMAREMAFNPRIAIPGGA